MVDDDEPRALALELETVVPKRALHIIDANSLACESFFERRCRFAHPLRERSIARPRLHISSLLLDRRRLVESAPMRLLLEREHDLGVAPLDLAHHRRPAIV